VEGYLFPWVDIAQEAGAIGGDHVDALGRSGQLERERCCTMILDIFVDPHHGQIPFRTRP
jgi:hypothetical protein